MSQEAVLTNMFLLYYIPASSANYLAIQLLSEWYLQSFLMLALIPIACIDAMLALIPLVPMLA